MINTKKKYATTQDILKLLVTGLIIGVAITSPYAGVWLVKYGSKKVINKIWDEYNKAKFRQSIKRMAKRRLVEIKKVNGQNIIVLTEEGRRELLRFTVENIKIEKPKIWDGKWHVVIFDVKESKKPLREALRRKMRKLEMFQLQKSVYITPYPCKKEIDLIRNYYQLGKEISTITATDLDESEMLKNRFDLKQQ